jgi:VanZ family protein
VNNKWINFFTTGYAILIFILSSIPGNQLRPYKILSQDKLFHFLEYFGFGILLLFSFWNANQTIFHQHYHRWALLVGVIYGLTDEFHQFFVPGRSASIIDWIYDSLGILLAIIVFRVILQKLQEKKNAKARTYS